MCGEGFEHRKRWIEGRLQTLSGGFAASVCGFVVMDNHLHVLVRLEPVAPWLVGRGCRPAVSGKTFDARLPFACGCVVGLHRLAACGYGVRKTASGGFADAQLLLDDFGQAFFAALVGLRDGGQHAALVGDLQDQRFARTGFARHGSAEVGGF